MNPAFLRALSRHFFAQKPISILARQSPCFHRCIVQNLRLYELAPFGLSYRLRSRTLATGPTAYLKDTLKAPAPPQHKTSKFKRAANTNAIASSDPSRSSINTKPSPNLTASKPTKDGSASRSKSAAAAAAAAAAANVFSRRVKGTETAPQPTSTKSKPTNPVARALASGPSVALEGTLRPPAPPKTHKPEQNMAVKAKVNTKVKTNPTPSCAIKASPSLALTVSKSESGANAPCPKSSSAPENVIFKSKEKPDPKGSSNVKGTSGAKDSFKAKGSSNVKVTSNAKGLYDAKRGKGSSQSSCFIALFFAEYPSFDYNPRKPVMREFARMCTCFLWDPRDKKNRVALKARRDLKRVLVLQFNKIYGTNVNDIQAWQTLCRILRIEVPGTLKGCKEAVRNTHVNLVDLVDAKGVEPVEIFKSEAALATYTFMSQKFFPREDAEAGGLLKFLLRRILPVVS